MSDEAKDLYVSSVEGHLVTRFGAKLYIGASRNPADPSQITWDLGLVVKIPEAEVLAYGREYRAAIAAGSLLVRTAADFEAFVAAQAAATEKELADRKAAEEKAKAEAEKPAAVPTVPDPTKAARAKTGPARGAGETKE